MPFPTLPPVACRSIAFWAQSTDVYLVRRVASRIVGHNFNRIAPESTTHTLDELPELFSGWQSSPEAPLSQPGD
jgi:hypothetical protein